MTETDESPDEEGYWHSIGKRRREILSVREEMTEDRGAVAAVIDWMGRLLASPIFFILFMAAHLLWIVLNLGVIPGLRPWDPYPFIFLATMASAEAPAVALLILMRQERDRTVDELRGEVSLQVALHVERKNTRILQMVARMGEEMGVEVEDAESEQLQEELDPERLMSTLQERLREVDEEPPGE